LISPPKKRPTIKDVAERAGLSLSTVSLAINNSGYVSVETKTRVLNAVRELGYHPSRAARGLASKTSGNIGFILTDDHFSQAEPFYTKVFLGMEFEARDHNYYILLTTVGRQFKQGGPKPRFLLERNVDGVIIAGRINERLVEYIESLGLPIVLVDYELPRKRVSTVLIDNRKGALLATQHLMSLGHRDIGFIGGDLDHPSIRERFSSFKNTMEEGGLSPDEQFLVTHEVDTRVYNGYSAAERLLGATRKPSAVFAANDAMAIGCIQSAKQRGMTIPDDLAIIGFDDIEMGSHIDPRLSTVRVFKEELGVHAVRRLVDVVKSKTKAVVTTYVPVELVVRESTGGSRESEPSMQGD
jgi:LacI family transcriptional regulator